MPLSPESRDQARRLLSRARSLTVLTGAGISAESGVPTFRGPEGLWEGRRPEEVATPQAFRENPEEVWSFYRWRRDRIAPLRPNAAHRVLADWSGRYDPLRLVTQNVDGLHTAAGSPHVLELHGSLWRTRCTGCLREEENRRRLEGPVPACRTCGRPLRPAVVWFGEPLPLDLLQSALDGAASHDLLLCIGTSALVQPAASLPLVALQHGHPVIEINPEPTPLSEVATLCLRGPAGEILPALDRALDHAPDHAPDHALDTDPAEHA